MTLILLMFITIPTILCALVVKISTYFYHRIPSFQDRW